MSSAQLMVRSLLYMCDSLPSLSHPDQIVNDGFMFAVEAVPPKGKGVAKRSMRIVKRCGWVSVTATKSDACVQPCGDVGVESESSSQLQAPTYREKSMVSAALSTTVHS